MSAIAEIAVAIFACLVETSIVIARFAVAPLRYLFSAQYRTSIQERWRGRHWLRAFELTGGFLVLSTFVCMLTFWILVFTRRDPPLSATDAKDLETRILDKVQDLRGKSR